MSQPYIGEIRMFAGNFAPAGWAFCDGQLLPISENDALFSLIGTTYGGDGETTFGLPDLRGRVPIHEGSGANLSTRTIGEKGGSETVSLTVNQIPAHEHLVLGSANNGAVREPADKVPAVSGDLSMYAPVVPSVNFSSQAVGAGGGNQPHDNLMPYQCIHFIISLFGIYPSQT